MPPGPFALWAAPDIACDDGRPETIGRARRQSRSRTGGDDIWSAWKLKRILRSLCHKGALEIEAIDIEGYYRFRVTMDDFHKIMDPSVILGDVGASRYRQRSPI